MRTSPNPPNQQQPAHAAHSEAVAADAHEHRNDGARQISSFTQ